MFILTVSENNLSNQEILDEIVHQDYASITNTIEKFLALQIEKNKAKGLIVGLSGGIDSAVLAYICKRALKEKTLALVMPDTDITPNAETEDAMKMIALTGLEYKLIDIKPIVKEYSQYLEPNEWAKGNLRARVRANILYYYANSKNYLVLGSSDKSEYLIGYFTEYGGHVTVRALAEQALRARLVEVERERGYRQRERQRESQGRASLRLRHVDPPNASH